LRLYILRFYSSTHSDFMFEQQPETLRQRVQKLANQSLGESDPSAWFDILYTEAQGDPGQVPWAKLMPHPMLDQWLSDRTITGEGRRALVTGCGLGDDAEALAARGFEVTAFDISPTAIAWCHQRFPDSPVTYLVADLFNLDPAWQGRFDLVEDCRNIQALPLTVRSQVIQAITAVLAPGGTLLLITRHRDDDSEPDGPPWPLSDRELAEFEALGLVEIQRQEFREADQSLKQLLLEYRKMPLN
jgi:SAM-dependent methyltransferase